MSFRSSTIAITFCLSLIRALSGELHALEKHVSYEDFGARGDGLADDLPAICEAHEHANKNNIPVKSKPGAIYNLGRKALTAIIATDTDWNTSRFIIDDSKGVDDPRKSIFEVRSLMKPISLDIHRLKRGQTSIYLNPERDCLVLIENRHKRIFIRKGLNQNSGSVQKEVFILRKDGTIYGDIDWDYDSITRIECAPIEEKTLILRGGTFINMANRPKPDAKPQYWSRNIKITRSKTLVDGITQHVTEEGDYGHPYNGFLSASQSAMITFRNCVIDGRKFYYKIGSASKSVAMGTYGYSADSVVDFRMINCRMGNDINDRQRWGIVGTNFMKHFLVEDCALSRVDVHQGVSGSYIIRRTTLGHAGLNAIGRGKLIVEDSTFHSNNFIRFRDDYGSTWDGDVIIRNSRWIPDPKKSDHLILFEMKNDGSHNFGYPCSMPRLIQINGLFIDDSARSNSKNGPFFFGNPAGSDTAVKPFPYRLTERIEIKNLNTASGMPVMISGNESLYNAIKVVK